MNPIARILIEIWRLHLGVSVYVRSKPAFTFLPARYKPEERAVADTSVTLVVGRSLTVAIAWVVGDVRLFWRTRNGKPKKDKQPSRSIIQKWRKACQWFGFPVQGGDMLMVVYSLWSIAMFFLAGLMIYGVVKFLGKG